MIGFDELRRSAFAVAYRMLGSVSEAEDLVQEGFLRLHRARAGGERIESPRAYLSTVVSRLSLDHLRSARVRRATYVGEWLPEPLVASAADDPARRAEMAHSLSLAFLVVLESLSPEQRAAFLPARGVRRALRPDRGDRRHERAERPPARHTGPPPRGGASPPLRGLARAAGGARDPLLRGRRGRRSPRAGGAAGPRRGAPRRRRRQGTRPQTCAPRPRQGGTHADRGPARRHPLRLDLAPRGGQRATRCRYRIEAHADSPPSPAGEWPRVAHSSGGVQAGEGCFRRLTRLSLIDPEGCATVSIKY